MFSPKRIFCSLAAATILLAGWLALPARGNAVMAQDATPEATPETTPLAPVDAKPGHWIGEKYDLEFDLTSADIIENFKATVPFGDGTCALELKGAVVSADGAFDLSTQMTEDAFEDFVQGGMTDAQWNFVKANAKFPEAINGMMIVQQIQGQFESPEQVSGAIKVLICEDGWVSGDETTPWTAQWVSELEATPEATSTAQATAAS